jgi:hypothetical protein
MRSSGTPEAERIDAVEWRSSCGCHLPRPALAVLRANIRRSADHDDDVKWFTTLPLWLDLGDLRVVHACWEPSAIAGLGTPCLDEDLLVAASTGDSDEFRWVEHLCKGPEVTLPAGHAFHDKEGNRRTEARFRWWDARSLTYASACEVPPNCMPPLPDTPIEDLAVDVYDHEVPVIFGHYWRDWPTIELTNTTACVDYSVVKGGPLVAYRWSGETTLTDEHLALVDRGFGDARSVRAAVPG